MRSAIEIAKQIYERKREEWLEDTGYTPPSFEEMLGHYLKEGFVFASPAYFVAAKAINLAKEGEPQRPAWFIHAAVGALEHLVTLFPFQLPEIAFHRRYEVRRRVYPAQRLIQLARRKYHG